MSLIASIVDASGTPRDSATGEEAVDLVYRPDYQPGDCIRIESAVPDLVVSLDDTLAPTLLYAPSGLVELPVPFGDARTAYSPRAFIGGLHRISARRARPEEVSVRRNLALNPCDHGAAVGVFPHARANVHTRGEAQFAPRNVIDGETANDRHGNWPYHSWGIDRRADAEITVDFGRPVEIDEVVIHLRADFPHDAWWDEATVAFSDGSEMVLPLVKTGAGQSFRLPSRVVTSATLCRMRKADDPSPYPALTQIAYWGRVTA